MTRPSYQSRTRRDNPDLDALLAELGDRVEADVRAGRRPPLTLYAAQALAPYRPRVFHELLVVEMQARQRAGELVAVEVFRERYPGQESAVEAAHRSAFGPAGGSSTGRRAIREGDVVGEYRLVRMVGHGGMGLVFLAEDVGSGESVAVKFLPPELLGASPELASQARLMFAREADAALQIDHPNVVKVRGRGEEDGFAYLVMEYVNGPSLREQLRRTGPLPPRDAAEVIEAVARGLEAAHELGILHRDIKPGNVLLQLRGPEESGGSDDPTVPVRGLAPDATTGTGPGERSSPLEVIIPKLADFGLAKQLDPTRSEATLTVGGMGTLTYSAPEQAGGKTHTGRRADVYSLGATLYECLTGRPPFHAADAMETLRQVLDEDPAPPRRLNPQVPPGVDLVCLKCLRKDPHKRYATAGELADDLRRFIDGRRVRARRESMWERGVKWTRRHPARAAGLAVGFIALVALGGVWRGLERQREMDQITRRVDDLVQAEPSRVSGLIDELVRGGSRAEAVVRERWDQSDPRPRERARLALALVKFDPKSDDSPPARLLVERLPVADAGELRLIREALAPRADQLRPTVVAGLDGPDPDQRLRFAAVLAGHEPDAPELVPHWNGLAERLVRENPVDLAAWVDMLRPATRHLRPPLEKLFKERHRADEARAAAAVLVALLERPTDLLDLIDLDADAVQYRYIADKLLTRPDETRVELAQRLTGRWEGSTEAEKDIRARAQAHYAALALRLDPDGPAWTHLLQPPSEDCRLQSYLVHWLPSRGVPADAVLRRCDLESGLAALLLTLGSYD
ncbi:MAG TPA: serine/threonine-protein kinase, partial [Gemmataceae bacterium]|nr:serine/threonine-protein kinase [Gemmataceae bacterium]